MNIPKTENLKEFFKDPWEIFLKMFIKSINNRMNTSKTENLLRSYTIFFGNLYKTENFKGFCKDPLENFL